MSNLRIFKSINLAADILLSGKMLIYPTESVFGIGCIPDFLETVNGIRKLKNRDNLSGFILVCSSIEQIEKYLDNSIDIDKIKSLLLLSSNDFPLTIILKASNFASDIIKGTGDTIAVRLTSFSPLINLCNYIESPIISTSANLKGSIPAININQCLKLLEYNDKLYIWDQKLGNANNTSTIYNSITNCIVRGNNPLLWEICVENNQHRDIRSYLV